MNKRVLRFFAALLSLVAVTAGAEAVDDYATWCSQNLVFMPSEVPDLNCNNGTKFAGAFSGTARLDYVGYKRVNTNNDLVFACRWMNNGPLAVLDSNPKTPPFQAASSIEMIIHNRSTGGTCFFAAKPGPVTFSDGSTKSPRVSTTIVSPFASNANSYWMRPDEIESATNFPSAPRGSGSNPTAALRCVGCHIAGPYIASLDVAPFLAQFGLLNDKHDTTADMMSTNYHYNVVGSNKAGDTTTQNPRGFKTWNTRIFQSNNLNECSSGCHSVGNITTTNPFALNIFINDETTGFNQLLIPSLASNISDIQNAHAMPPSDNSSPYRWMNVDIPDDANTTGDVEVFYELKSNVVGFTPKLNKALTCETEPSYMEARLVGSGVTYKTNEYTAANVGFTDKLERFDQTGLICRNASQPGGMCNNYAVRFICFPDQLSVYNRWTGRVLTIANPDANQIRWMKGQPLTPAWYGSQTWHLEGLNDGSTNYSYVRFRNDWSTMYLNADDTTSVTADSKSVTVAYFRDWWLSEQWVMEHVPGTHYVRFRSLWKTGLYLTMVESSDYSIVNLQPLHKDSAGNPNWTSQEWELK